MFAGKVNVIRIQFAVEERGQVLVCVWYCGSGCGCGLKKIVL